VLDSDWGTTPTLTTDAAGDSCCRWPTRTASCTPSTANNLAAGPIWQEADRHRRRLPDLAGTGPSPPGSSRTARCTTPAAATWPTARLGGSITAFQPRHRRDPVEPQTEQPILGSPAYVNGMIGETEGNTFEVLNASSGALLYSILLPAPVYGAVSVARSQFYVGDTNDDLYAFGLPSSTTTPPADPNCPATFTCQDIRSPGVAGLRARPRRHADRDRIGRGHPRHLRPSSGSSPSPVTGDSQVRAWKSCRRARRTPSLSRADGPAEHRPDIRRTTRCWPIPTT